MALLSFLDRERIIAKPGFNRWLVPPAALAIHLSIGQAYAFSVFNKPLTKLVAVSQLAPTDTLRALRNRSSWMRWRPRRPTGSFPTVGVGVQPRDRLSRIVGGDVRRVARSSGTAQGDVRERDVLQLRLLRRSLGVYYHQFWLLLLGYGVLGGIGLGLGYISPVSTLIKWFPDKPGMATGLAIMGFGGGAMIAAPLSVKLMQFFHSLHHGARRRRARLQRSA